MSDLSDADTLRALIQRSREEETPGRRRAAQGIRQRIFPLVPVTVTAGVSRDDIQARMRPWGVMWDRPRLDRAVKALVDEGVLRFGPRGFYLVATGGA